MEKKQDPNIQLHPEHYHTHFVPVVVTLACAIVILAGVKAAADLLTPLLLALFIAIVCSPLIKKMMRYKIPQWLAIGILLLVIFIGFSIFASMIGASINEFTASLPQYKTLLTEKMHWLLNWAQHYNLDALIPRQKVAESFDPNTVMNFVSNALGQVSGMVSDVFVLFLIVVFMLSEIPLAKRKLNYLVSGQTVGEQRQVKSNVYRVVDGVIQYLSIKTITSIMTGIVIYVVLKLLGVQYAILWGTLAFLLNYVPNIGSIIAAIPAVIQAFILNGVLEGVVLIATYTAINIVVGSMVEPKMMGSQLGLSTLIVFISLIFWGWLLGIVGMFLSVPLTMATKIALEANPATEKLAYILGNGEK